MRFLIIILLVLSIAGCQTTKDPETVIIQRVYFPKPPEILMRPAPQLETIKEENGREQPRPVS